MVHPFQNRLMGLTEIVNEICIVMAGYHMFWFTNYVSDLESELIFGWSLISLILFNVSFNIVIFTISLV